MNWMVVLFGFIILQRLVELMVAKRNEKWMKEQGGVEVPDKHYKWIVLTHILFFVAILFETKGFTSVPSRISYVYLSVFLLTQVVRIWCLSSLGRFWNTKIIILPSASLIDRGPYRFIRHPNYLIVGIEFIVIPLMFHAYLTAIIFPVLHLLLMKARIPKEESALDLVGSAE